MFSVTTDITFLPHSAIMTNDNSSNIPKRQVPKRCKFSILKAQDLHQTFESSRFTPNIRISNKKIQLGYEAIKLDIQQRENHHFDIRSLFFSSIIYKGFSNFIHHIISISILHIRQRQPAKPHSSRTLQPWRK